jgi:Tfp pilus assembly protein PilP
MFFTDFAKSGTVNGVTINGIFDEGYQQQLGIIEDQNPMFTVKDSDIVGITHGMAVVINSRNFKIREIQPDGNGITVLQLSAV